MSDLTRPLPPIVTPEPAPMMTRAAKLQALQDRAAKAVELHGLIEKLNGLDCSAITLHHWNTGMLDSFSRDEQKQIVKAGVEALLYKCRKELDYMLGE